LAPDGKLSFGLRYIAFQRRYGETVLRCRERFLAIRVFVGPGLVDELQDMQLPQTAVWKRPQNRLAGGEPQQRRTHRRQHGYPPGRRTDLVGEHDRHITNLSGALVLESHSRIHRYDVMRNKTRLQYIRARELRRKTRVPREDAKEFEIIP
jgi:hypothetical protein